MAALMGSIDIDIDIDVFLDLIFGIFFYFLKLCIFLQIPHEEVPASAARFPLLPESGSASSVTGSASLY